MNAQTPLIVPREVQQKLRDWVEDGYPYEACGLLVGRTTEFGLEVVLAAQARNTETERRQDRFQLAPDDWLSVENQARANGLEIIGIWHSHPDHPAMPSQTDLEAAWEGYAYAILSVTAGGVTDLRSWQLSQGSFQEQPVKEQ